MLAQGIDSAQWPFPDPFFMSCSLTGNYTTTLDEIAMPGRQAVDSTWTIYHTSGVPEYGYPYDAFAWKEVQSIDTLGWHLTNQVATVTIAFDSLSHTIFRMELNYNSDDDAQPTESLYYTLHLLHYNDTTISCSDNDLWRHVSSAGYAFGDINDFENETITFSGLDGFGFYAVHLAPGFSFPSTIDFGIQSFGSIHDTTIVLQNLSDTVLTIYSYALQDSDSGFLFIDTNAHFIAAQDSGAITVRFTPHEAKMYSGNVHIVTDEPYAPTYSIQVLGSVVASDVTTSSANSETLEILPDIANESVTVSFPSNNGQLTIHDILGHERYSTHDLTYSSLSIDTHSWPNGTYIATYNDERGSFTSKFVVQH